MRPGMMMLCVAVVAAVCYGCAPPQLVRLGGPPPGVAVAVCPAGYNFARTVQFLNSGFQKSPPYTLPVLTPISPTSAVYADLNSAFGLAPVWFQNELCSLDGVFIDQTKCADLSHCFSNSWGVRNFTTVPATRYIAVSQGLWASRPTYSSYENQLLQTLLPPHDYYVQYSAANTPSDLPFEFTLLAALAHEVGHVRYYDILRNPRPTPNCFGGFFASWQSVYQPPTWRHLLTPSERQQVSRERLYSQHKGTLQTADIDRAAQTPYGGDLLDGIYAPTNSWASYFASLSPDEDFVETYKFAVLTQSNTPLVSLPITIQGSSVQHKEDIPAAYWNTLNLSDYSKANLVLKTQCAASFM